MKNKLQPVDPSAPPREVIVGYGTPGSGKTRLFTSLTERFGKIAYIALDEGSESLDSVLPQYRERITVFRPLLEEPVIDAAQIALTNWKEEGYDTLIIDTFSNLTRTWLWHVTQTGAFQDKRNMIGKPGQEGAVALPDKGHYGGVHGIIRNFMVTLFRHNPNTNIIFICHEQVDRDDDTGKILLAGPATVGRAMLNEFPSLFKTVIRVTTEKGQPLKQNGKIVEQNKFVARMAQHGHYIARRNEANPDGNPIKSVDLEPDPVNFWKKLEEMK